MAADLKGRIAAKANQDVARQAPPDPVEQRIAGLQNRFAQAAPKGMEATQLVRDAIQVIRKTPKLLDCSFESVAGSLMTCAQLGLRPGIGALGQAHIVPFWNKNLPREDGGKGGFEAQFIIGYQGMIELGNRSNQIDYLTAEMVCENDTFEPDLLGGHHIHKPPLRGLRGDVIGYYAGFIRRDSDRMKLVYKSREDMVEHRDRFATTKSKDGRVFGPWVDHFDAMGLKTMVRELFTWMPRSTELSIAVTADESIRLDIDDMDVTHASRHINPEDLGETIPGEAVQDDAGYAPTPEEQEEILRQEREGR